MTQAPRERFLMLEAVFFRRTRSRTRRYFRSPRRTRPTPSRASASTPTTSTRPPDSFDPFVSTDSPSSSGSSAISSRCRFHSFLQSSFREPSNPLEVNSYKHQLRHNWAKCKRDIIPIANVINNLLPQRGNWCPIHRSFLTYLVIAVSYVYEMASGSSMFVEQLTHLTKFDSSNLATDRKWEEVQKKIMNFPPSHGHQSQCWSISAARWSHNRRTRIPKSARAAKKRGSFWMSWSKAEFICPKLSRLSPVTTTDFGFAQVW